MKFTNTITFLGDRYEVSLPWKPFHNPRPDNYNLSLRPLTGLFRRLQQDHKLLKDYNDIIQQQVEKGIVEDVPTTKDASTHIHYLPHHAVLRSDKTNHNLEDTYADTTLGRHHSVDLKVLGVPWNPQELRVVKAASQEKSC